MPPAPIPARALGRGLEKQPQGGEGGGGLPGEVPPAGCPCSALELPDPRASRMGNGAIPGGAPAAPPSPLEQQRRLPDTLRWLYRGADLDWRSLVMSL